MLNCGVTSERHTHSRSNCALCTLGTHIVNLLNIYCINIYSTCSVASQTRQVNAYIIVMQYVIKQEENGFAS